jgi:type II secretion system protein G
MKKTEKGFTLIEMMLVVGIIALLSAIVIPRFNDFKSTAETETRSAQLASIRTQIELYKQDKGEYPSSMKEDGWEDLSNYWPNEFPSTDAKGNAWTYDSVNGLIE